MDNKQDLYHCCRSCKWFEKGRCTNERVFGELSEVNLSPFYEDGHLSEAVREGFTEFKATELHQALIETKLSRKKIHELMVLLASDIDSAIVNWVEGIDDTVSTSLNNFSDSLGARGIEIKDPTEFYCKHFW